MLPGVTLPASLAALLGALRPCFTAPGFVTFCGLAAGLAGQVRRRTVVGMPCWAGPCSTCGRMTGRTTSSPGPAGKLDQLGLAVAQLVVLMLAEPGACG